MKLTKRKGFNFFRSYYDVYNMLSDKDKVAFMDALLEMQFQGVEPTQLKGQANFAWISQFNSISAQCKGWEDKTGLKLNKQTVTTPTEGARQGGLNTPTRQVEGKGEVEVEGKGEDIHPLQKWIKNELKQVSKISNQLTKKDCERLLEDFPADLIKNTLMDLENYKEAPKKYTSVNLTVRKWAKKDLDNPQNNPNLRKKLKEL